MRAWKRRVLMWQCECGAIGTPEDVDDAPEGKEKAPPYGWIVLVGDVGVMGSGPWIGKQTLTACSTKCLMMQLERLLNEQRDEEFG